MPYFHIDISQSASTQYVVTAPDRETAESIALTADGLGKCDNKKIIKLGTSSNSSISAVETNKAGWTDALKQQKANK